MAMATPRLNSTVLDYLKRELLLREGHFEFRSGRHTSVLLDRDRLIAEPEIASRMGYALAKAFFVDKIDTVATPSIWGAGLAQWVAYFLEPRAHVVHATPTRGGERHVAENLHRMIRGKRLAVVDNLIVSGETIQSFVDMLEELGGEIIQIGALWDLADLHVDGQRVYGLLDDIYPAWKPEDCPLCASGDDEIEQIPY